MKLSILIGGKAGQGINLVSGLVSQTLIHQGYFTFNYRDYPSIIRGGHNFNILTLSDKQIMSHETTIDIIVSMDELTTSLHKSELNKGGIIIESAPYEKYGLNLNVALAGALMKILGFNHEVLIENIKANKSINNEKGIEAAQAGFDSVGGKYNLSSQKKKLTIMTGSKGVAIGAVNSGIDLYTGYPMTPSSALLHDLAGMMEMYGHFVFQAENELSAVNSALGASFAGAKVMTGSSGGGFDLMTEALSLQGTTELPLVVHLAQRPGPATGLPTFTSQGDLGLALRAGHGEFPRIVAAPGTPNECVEVTNELFYLTQKYGSLGIVLTDKHLLEGEYSYEDVPKKPLAVKVDRKVPGTSGFISKVSSYEQGEDGNVTEDGNVVIKTQNDRLARYENIRRDIKEKNISMYKLYGKKNSKNLIIGWGSTCGAIIDSINEGDLDAQFLQVIYMKPMSPEIKKIILKAKNVILVENNLTGQLGRLLRERFLIGIPKQNRILRYDGRPFTPGMLMPELKKRLKK